MIREGLGSLVIYLHELWDYESVGHTQDAKKEIVTLFGNDVFGTPKPERLIQRILRIATNPNDLVLDSFAGSGTTGAVAHKMGRRWIMVELGEHCHTHIIPRLKKVIDGDDQGGQCVHTLRRRARTLDLAWADARPVGDYPADVVRRRVIVDYD